MLQNATALTFAVTLKTRRRPRHPRNRLEPPKTILREDGSVIAENVKALRRFHGLTQGQLAERSKIPGEPEEGRLSRQVIGKIEAGRDRWPLPVNLRKLHIGLGLEFPTYDMLPNHLTGERWSYHWTHDPGHSVVLKKCRWKFESTGVCELIYLPEPSPAAAEKPLVFQGKAKIEENRLFCTLDSNHPTIRERLVWLFEEVPSVISNSPLQGAWFGVDFDRKKCGSGALLSKSELADAEAIRKLAEIPDFLARPQGIVRGDIRMTGIWNDSQMQDAIIHCEEGATITAMSTYFPEGIALKNCIRELANQTHRNQKATVRILLLNHRQRSLIEARAKHRGNDGRDDFTPDFLEALIKRQLKEYLDLRQEVRDTVNLEVRSFKAWPFGMCFQIGRTAMYFGLIMATKPAVEGPMFILSDPKSPSWQLLQTDLETVWTGAEPAVLPTVKTSNRSRVK